MDEITRMTAFVRGYVTNAPGDTVELPKETVLQMITVIEKLRESQQLLLKAGAQ